MPDNELISNMQATIESMANTIETINKVLTVGNGQPALVVRVALIEQLALESKKELYDFKTKVESDKKAESASKSQRMIVFITCVVSMLTAIVPHILAALMKRP